MKTGSFLYGLLLKWPHFDITKKVNGETVVYLRRFFLFRSAWVNKLLRKIGIKARLNIGNVYLHHILRSDDDPDPHDHPWNFVSLILSGGYHDEQWFWNAPFTARWTYSLDRLARQHHGFQLVKPRTIVRRKAEHIHRVILHLDDRGREIPSWSLVFAGPYRRNWNFITARGPVVWWDYLHVKEPQFKADDGLE